MRVLVIIPCYNEEGNILNTVNDLKKTKVDYIVINDGSTDKSSQIAHHFEAKYSNSFRVIDKANGNYGSCSAYR